VEGFFVRPKKPSEMIRKLNLTELISDLNQPEEILNEKVNVLALQGALPVGVYDIYQDKTSDFPTFPYAIFNLINIFRDFF
jgi:hypothetical protein